MVEVAGGALHVVDIGPRDAAGPPIVMLHGASSNLEVMRQPVGDRLAKNHRVILIDRPGHGWSTRARLEDSTPEIQGRMIEEALAKLGVSSAIFVVHSWAGALGARMALDYPQARRRSGDAGAGGLSVAGRRRPVQQDRHHAGDRPAAGLHGHAAARRCCWPSPAPAACSCRRRCRRAMSENTATPLLLRPREFLANARDLVTLKAGGRRAGAALRRDQGADHDHLGR